MFEVLPCGFGQYLQVDCVRTEDSQCHREFAWGRKSSHTVSDQKHWACVLCGCVSKGDTQKLKRERWGFSLHRRRTELGFSDSVETHETTTQMKIQNIFITPPISLVSLSSKYAPTRGNWCPDFYHQRWVCCCGTSYKRNNEVHIYSFLTAFLGICFEIHPCYSIRP